MEGNGYENNLNSYFDKNYKNNQKILEEVYGFDKTLIKKLYIFLNPKNLDEAFNYLTKKNNIYQHYFYNNYDNNKCLICNEEMENHINYYLEKYIIKEQEPINLNDVRRYQTKEKAMLKIILNNCTGSGFLCEIKYKNKIYKTLFTNNHVLPKEKIKKGLKIKVENNNKIKYIEIKDNRFAFTNMNLDYTCIQIFNNDNFDTFFEIDNKINCNNPSEEYKNDKIVIMQYPGGKDISFSEGKIVKIDDDDIIHNISTECGSSGSPLIISTRNLNVIGIHCRKIGNENLNKGIYFKPILDDIEIQLNNLNQIQFDDDNKFNYISDIDSLSTIYDDFSKIYFEPNNYNKKNQFNDDNKFTPISHINLGNKIYDAFSKEQFLYNNYNWYIMLK